MLPLGLAVLLGGYTLAYFGIASLRGPGTGLLDLIVPGRYKPPTPNVAASAPAPPQSANVPKLA